MVQCQQSKIVVPATGECVFEGVVRPAFRKLEGGVFHIASPRKRLLEFIRMVSSVR